MADLFASTSGPDSPECIRIPAQLYKNQAMHGNQAEGSLVLEQTSTQLVMLYYMGSKKHLPGRIVPLRVPFLGYACPKVHARTARGNAGKNIWEHIWKINKKSSFAR